MFQGVTEVHGGWRIAGGHVVSHAVEAAFAADVALRLAGAPDAALNFRAGFDAETVAREVTVAWWLNSADAATARLETAAAAASRTASARKAARETGTHAALIAAEAAHRRAARKARLLRRLVDTLRSAAMAHGAEAASRARVAVLRMEE